MNAIIRLVAASTGAQGLPIRVEDAAAAKRVAVLLDVDSSTSSTPSIPTSAVRHVA